MISNSLSNDTKIKLEMQYYNNHMFLSVLFVFQSQLLPPFTHEVYVHYRSGFKALEEKIVYYVLESVSDG